MKPEHRAALQLHGYTFGVITTRTTKGEHSAPRESLLLNDVPFASRWQGGKHRWLLRKAGADALAAKYPHLKRNPKVTVSVTRRLFSRWDKAYYDDGQLIKLLTEGEVYGQP